jgi:UDPglucose--hexose-1-phosphate uridylyltransferase
VSFIEQPHRRLNLLTGEWVLVSPHRTKRPWQGQVEKPAPTGLPGYEAGCYLCPGNTRASGGKNPDYTSTYSFDNDFAALLPDTPPGEINERGLLRAESERGLCRVVCFSPDHSLTIGQMSTAQVRPVVEAWVEEYRALSAHDFIGYVQIFENRGAMMGCSNPHPHGQIWATQHVPVEVVKEDARQREHPGLLDEYLALELGRGERVVCQNASFVCLVPWWAVWPFETMVLCRRPVTAIDELDEAERTDLADMLRRTAARYDNVFAVSFPYSFGLHQRPSAAGDYSHWRLHGHYLPPLLRSATVRKFMVGYELLANPQRDITPESAAARLREASEEPLPR